MDKKIYLLMIVFLCIGEISEITEQQISYNDYVKQYAILQFNPANGNKYFKPCLDCSGKITVYDTENRPIVYNRDMVDLNNGLFGYMVMSSEFQTDKYYRCVINFTSLSMGSGISETKFIVNNPITLQNEITPNNAPVTVESATLTTNLDLTSENINNIIKKLIEYVTPDYSLLNNTTTSQLIITAIKTILFYIVQVLNQIYLLYILIGAILIILKLYSFILFIKDTLFTLLALFILFIKSPQIFITGILIPWLIGLIIGTFLLFFIIILFIEIMFIGVSVMTTGGDLIKMLTKYFTLHFNAIYYVVLSAYTFMMGTIRVIEILIRIIMTVVPTKS